MKRAVWMGVVISRHLVTQFMTSQCSCRRLLFSASMPSCACKATSEQIQDDWGKSINITNMMLFSACMPSCGCRAENRQACDLTDGLEDSACSRPEAQLNRRKTKTVQGGTLSAAKKYSLADNRAEPRCTTLTKLSSFSAAQGCSHSK